jgi:hypothetical protein
MNFGKHVLKAAVAFGAALLTASTANASITSVTFDSDTSVHHLSQFQGTAVYDSSTGKLSITIENTTAGKKGGYLTAIALNGTGPSATFEDATPATAKNAKFDDLQNKNGVVKASPYGKYEIGAGVAGKWNKNTGAKHGVAAGSGMTFIFDTTATDKSTLDVMDFMSANKSGEEVVASFRKLAKHRNDQAGATVTGTMSTLTNQDQPISETGLLPLDTNDHGPASVSAVPLPPAAYMGLLTIGIFGMLRRKLGLAVA